MQCNGMGNYFLPLIKKHYFPTILCFFPVFYHYYATQTFNTFIEEVLYKSVLPSLFILTQMFLIN